MYLDASWVVALGANERNPSLGGFMGVGTFFFPQVKVSMAPTTNSLFVEASYRG